jgi:hypothetical protein
MAEQPIIDITDYEQWPAALASLSREQLESVVVDLFDSIYWDHDEGRYDRDKECLSGADFFDWAVLNLKENLGLTCTAEPQLDDDSA